MNAMVLRLLCEPLVDGSIVMAADTESALCEELTVLDIGLSTVLLQQFQQHRIFSLTRDNDHILEVLRSGADK